ncbi:MAG: hypothetical protein M1833_007194 [Piccolia ochrophora]|nr:MAG: hypothetical protein M1833_007194 [Piccolia ochrophora]
MPPKKEQGGKKPTAAKVVEDKTFGMKNKKGSTAKKQIAQIASAASSAKTPEQKRKEAEKAQREKDKKAAEDAKRETAELFKPLQVQKVPFGVDPKTILCQFYKNGSCEKGKSPPLLSNCKFSHDLSVERKAEKKNLYADTREEDPESKEEREKEETVDDWDEEKLRKVVTSKHGNPKTTTDKVCKYFIDAVENGKYGWFWQCPNGGDKCMYRHSLPVGFVLKTSAQRAAEKALMDKSPLATLTLEDFLETSRHALTGTLTPVTPESFAKWKAERLDKKQAEDEARRQKEATGRAMFESGDWRNDGESSEEEEESEGEGADEVWNLEALRRETEEAGERRERERVANGEGAVDG